MAGESTVYIHANEAPQPVRFPRHQPLILVRPVAPKPEQLERNRNAPPSQSPPAEIYRWMDDLSQRISREWKDHEGKKEHLVTEFKVHTDGKVSDIRVTRSSGSQSTDEDAVRAVDRASPFKHLPKYLTESFADIQYTFDDRFTNDQTLSRKSAPRIDTPNQEIVR